jgi:hypothetical protein
VENGRLKAPANARHGRGWRRNKEESDMNGLRFYADLPNLDRENAPMSGGPYPNQPCLAKPPSRITVQDLREFGNKGSRLNVVALLLGDEHRCHDYSQEALAATFGYPDSDTSLGSVCREYLRRCRRIPEAVARKLHPQLFQRLDAQ